MNRREVIRLATAAFLLPAALVSAQDDPGKAAIGKVNVKVYYGTNGDASVAGDRFRVAEAGIAAQLRETEQLDFKNYRLLGGDDQPLFRSYENWAQPLKPSDEILVRFEARSRPTPDSTRLDLEIWISRKKILKTDALLEGSRPLFILGPEWRGGRLIIAVSLAS